MAVAPELLRELAAVADVFHDTPHGDFLAKIAAAIRTDNPAPPPDAEVVQPGGVQHLRERHFDRSDIVELCDSHEALRRLWRNAVLAIAQHEYSITEGVRDPVEVDVELWANT